MDIGGKKSYNDQAGSFEIEQQQDGLYLKAGTVNEDAAAFLTAVKKTLQEMQAIDIDDNAITSASDNIGKSVKIAEAKPVVTLKISSDDMEASAQIKNNATPGKISKEEVIAELGQYGITFGIDEDGIQKLISRPGETFVVAKGTPAIDGKNGELLMKIKVSADKGQPKEISGGRVDYKNLDLFTSVTENDVIAELISATAGENGSTIKGKLLKAKDGKEKRITLGKNISVEGNTYIAKTAGHLVIGRDKIEVLPVLEIKEDIDFSTGNIDFPGNVVVRGSVQAGFYVKAGGNIQVMGSVFGGTVEGKSIDVKHGIQGAHNSYIKAEETLMAKFVENADIYAGNSIVVTDAVLHSKVSAGVKVTAMGGKGIIAGGHVSAGEEIEAKTIGTQMAPPTIVEVGVNPMIKEEYLNLRNEFKNAMEMFDSTKKSMQLIKPTEQSVVPPARAELYTKLQNTFEALTGRIGYVKERLLTIETEFDKLKEGKIKCSGIVYPGVKMVINNIVYPVRDNIQFSVFSVHEGEVKLSPYA